MTENEFGENPAIYVWPIDHEDGRSYGNDFWKRLHEALSSVGIDWERV